MAAVWRSFKFFNAELVKNPLCRMEMTCCCCGEGLVFAGGSDGAVWAVDRSSNNEGVKCEFGAYKGPVLYMKYVQSRNVLVTIGDDDGEDVCVIRVWNLEAAAAPGRISPPPCNEHRLFSSKHPPPRERVPLCPIYDTGSTSSPTSNKRRDATDCAPTTSINTVVASFDVADDLQCMAVALVSGDVILLHDDLERKKALRLQRLRSNIAKGPIAFVGFTRATYTPDATTKKTKNQQLFTLSTSRRGEEMVTHIMYSVYADCVTVWQVSSADCEEHSCDSFGGALRGRCCMTDDGQLVVASNASDHITVFGNKETLSPRKQSQGSFVSSHFSSSQAVEVAGRKCLLLSHRGYVVVLAQSDAWSDRFVLQCYDLPNRLRCLSRSQENYCTHVEWMLADSSDILVFCREPIRHVEASNSGSVTGYESKNIRTAAHACYQVVRLVEVGLEKRLQQLFQKECYEIAQSIACRSQSTPGGRHRKNQQLLDIKKHYGDYLVSKRDYTGAMRQYVDIIGHVEPSYVIRVFVDAQQIVPLTGYLEELHNTRDNHTAQRSHTTLLLCCYIQLHDEEKLNNFIRRSDVRFDPRTAIDVCTEARYYEAALYLAEKYAKPHDYVTVQLDHLNNPKKALEFIQALCLDDAEAILRQQHGKHLVAALPRRATEVLINLCVGWSGPARRLVGDEVATSKEEGAKHHNRGDAKDFLHILSDFPVCLLHFLRAVVNSGVLDDADPKREMVIYNTLLEMYVTRELKHATRGNIIPIEEESFVAESCEERRKQAYGFFTVHSGRYDPYHALLLAEQHGFEEGVFVLLRRLNCSTELMQYHAKGLAHGVPTLVRQIAKTRLIEICLNSTNDGVEQSNDGSGNGPKSGGSARELWLSLLSMLAHTPESDAQDISQVLGHIAAQDALSPLSVLTTLNSSNPELPLHIFRDYVVRMVQREVKRSESIKARTEARLKELHELHGKLDALQTRVTTLQAFNCNHCGSPLDLPAVYFSCQHAFHQRCLNDTARCNVCSPANFEFGCVDQPQYDGEDESDKFFHCLGGFSYEKGFDVVVERFSNGVTGLQGPRKMDAPCDSSSIVHGLLNSSIDLASSVNRSRGPSETVLLSDDDTYDESGELMKPEAVELW
ncbi:hypothetical protein, conserved [Trypanosoma brucei gambiense DAL972]|uniref:RING-type domain-containing protein n=1 Tax=Trypanosoma brucei gambiense (strain MHOM/CI/86/DAL972) TaxID=679716 RepID=C9ZWL4_TRYB9|nr:hypothetical protein, conserved [Trypanosoma brucei gambiense DAL972]CBH13803.1 hypothetical protein, conserved [Trypanosoma brucei gambiense DAL972]|eukprot:XP_011776079.1 hypothetical protein, conserved [Trypanosoma brucei gambiense DAL972]